LHLYLPKKIPAVTRLPRCAYTIPHFQSLHGRCW